MKVGVLYEEGNGVKDALKDSICAMLQKENIEVVSVGYAYSLMNYPETFSLKNQFKHKFKLLLKGKAYSMKSKNKLINSIKYCDFIVVVTVLPEVFLPKKFDLLNFIRSKLRVPIISYSNYYFGNKSLWPYWLNSVYKKTKNYTEFDYYLCTSDQSNYELPTNVQHPYYPIGFSLEQLPLSFKNKKSNFIALVDFPREGYEDLRRLQIQVLNDLKIETIVLDKKMSRSQLFEIYNMSSIFFLAFPESFGVPIIEFQTAGGLILIPDKHFVISHWLKADGKLGKNFILYEMNSESLKRTIIEQMGNFNAERNFLNFISEYPFFYSGKRENLQVMIQKIQTNEINCLTHQKYEGLFDVYSRNVEDFVMTKKRDWLPLLNPDKTNIESGKKLSID